MVFVSNTWIFLEWLNPYTLSFIIYFRGMLPFQVTEKITSPNTILQFMLIIILVFVISIIPVCVPTSRFRDSWCSAFDDYACVSIVGPIWQSFVLRRWSTSPILPSPSMKEMWKKGIRIMCCIICMHCFDTMSYGEKFRICLCLNFFVDFI